MKQLTGKAREHFLNYLEGAYGWEDVAEIGYDTMPQSAQFGLIQEWGDTLDINITTGIFGYTIRYEMTVINKHYVSRPEAQREAVKKLSEIYNKQEQE